MSDLLPEIRPRSFFFFWVNFPEGLTENIDEAALFHPYQLGASQSKGFEMSFTLAC